MYQSLLPQPSVSQKGPELSSINLMKESFLYLCSNVENSHTFETQLFIGESSV